jgi:hypothetical protein
LIGKVDHSSILTINRIKIQMRYSFFLSAFVNIFWEEDTHLFIFLYSTYLYSFETIYLLSTFLYLIKILKQKQLIYANLFDIILNIHSNYQENVFVNILDIKLESLYGSTEWKQFYLIKNLFYFKTKIFLQVYFFFYC